MFQFSIFASVFIFFELHVITKTANETNYNVFKICRDLIELYERDINSEISTYFNMNNAINKVPTSL